MSDITFVCLFMLREILSSMKKVFRSKVDLYLKSIKNIVQGKIMSTNLTRLTLYLLLYTFSTTLTSRYIIHL